MEERRHTMDTKNIEVSAGVRYWEDAKINGVEDKDGILVPFKNGEMWQPVIQLDDGLVKNWPEGMTGAIHYKVCDQGEYWLQDGSGSRVAKWKGNYVPDKFLCHGDYGFGDYIIFNVGRDGKIVGWRKPEIENQDWTPLSKNKE